MLDLYGGDDARRLALLQLTRDVHKRGWWAAYDDVLSGAFAELEDMAGEIRSWDTQLIPGLLQTEEYALALIRAGRQTSEEVIDERLRARMHRKTLLQRQHPPHLSVLLDEAVLRRPVGGAEMMRRQLNALVELGLKPNISIRVLPKTVGLHPALGEGSFMIFAFPPPEDPHVVYLETVAGGIYVEDVEQVTRCNAILDDITDMALTEEKSSALITAIGQEQYQPHVEPK
jgi:Domain of unknown function (DUF5753)